MFNIWKSFQILNFVPLHCRLVALMLTNIENMWIVYEVRKWKFDDNLWEMASALSQNLSEEESGQSDSELTEVTFKLPYEEVPARGGGVFYKTADNHLYR